MSQELLVSGALRWQKDGTVVQQGYYNVPLDTSADNPHVSFQDITVAEILVDLGDVGTGPYCLVRNLDTSNYVQLRSGQALASFARLRPGEIALFPFDEGSTLYAAANGASCRIEVTAVPKPT